MIALHTFDADFALPTPSPFALKVETQLKMSGLPYTKHIVEFSGPPKGKVPYIVDEEVVISEPIFIRRHLEQRHGVEFDGDYSGRERALAWSVERMVEDQLYWALLYNRWGIDENFYKGPAKFYDSFPEDVRASAMENQRDAQLSNIRAQGTGRHTLAEITDIADLSYAALAQLIGSRPYLLGEKPCGADASVFAHLACIMTPHFSSSIRDAACRHGDLVAYRDRLMAEFYPEFRT